MVGLRLNTVSNCPHGRGNEILDCAFTPDSAYVLSAGWDGRLRIWDAEQAVPIAEIAASAKPLSACQASADGSSWLTGSMDGMLGCWDASNHHQKSLFLAHTRPISTLVYAPDGKTLASASWDRNVILWHSTSERDSRTLTGHTDIVSGCAFSPDGATVFSWSHDKTVRVWDIARGRAQQEWIGHLDRITAGGISPDGRWLATGSRDRLLKLWSVADGREVKAELLNAEVRACLFLLDTESLVAVDANGRLTVHALPGMEVQSELETGLHVQCARLAPSGARIGLGTTSGELHVVEVDGFDSGPLAVTAKPTNRSVANLWHRLLGMQRFATFYYCICPACRKSFELPAGKPSPSSSCPSCQRHLRVCAVTEEMATRAGERRPHARNSGARKA